MILAAPASGSGKTLLTAALLRHLHRRGVRAAAAKAGPDFIDPTFLAAAAGSACVNLDPWAMRPSTLSALIGELEEQADIVLCEGVMGLFDGTGADGEAGSTADLARLTHWPIVLIVDASGQGASVAALLRGFAGHSPAVPLAAVVFNRVSGERHFRILAAATARHLPDLPVLGGLAADPALHLRSRHLGLVPAGEIAALDAILDRAAAQIGGALDIDRLLRLARPSQCRPAEVPPMAPLGQRVAVARDNAFGFAYPALLAAWRRQGAEIRLFSPLADEPPDADADAVFLPGGYPELFAGRIAAAQRFLWGLRGAAAAAMPVYGECGGYMVLGEALIDAAGNSHPMAGLLPLVTSFAERRRSLGYRGARLIADGPLGRAGTRWRGHEFHYATVQREGEADRLWFAADAADADLGPCGLRRDWVFGSFLHLIDLQDPAVPPNETI